MKLNFVRKNGCEFFLEINNWICMCCRVFLWLYFTFYSFFCFFGFHGVIYKTKLQNFLSHNGGHDI